MTLGSLKFRLTKIFPGLDADVLEGLIDDCYQEIIGKLAWSRQNVQTILQTVAPYSTGTVALTNGSTAVTLTSGTWTSGMTGRAFRVVGGSEFYELTYGSATTGTLDRAYEGATATGAAYKIFQHVYPLPSDCRLLEDDAFSTFDLGPLVRYTRAQLNASFPDRTTVGTPQAWAAYMDDSSSPPRMQVELYPVPELAVGIPLSYVAEATTPTASGSAFAGWVKSTALFEGVCARICRLPQFRDLDAAREHERVAKESISDMKADEARKKGGIEFTLGSYYTSHRSKRTRC